MFLCPKNWTKIPPGRALCYAHMYDHALKRPLAICIASIAPAHTFASIHGWIATLFRCFPLQVAGPARATLQSPSPSIHHNLTLPFRHPAGPLLFLLFRPLGKVAQKQFLWSHFLFIGADPSFRFFILQFHFIPSIGLCRIPTLHPSTYSTQTPPSRIER